MDLIEKEYIVDRALKIADKPYICVNGHEISCHSYYMVLLKSDFSGFKKEILCSECSKNVLKKEIRLLTFYLRAILPNSCKECDVKFKWWWCQKKHGSINCLLSRRRGIK